MKCTNNKCSIRDRTLLKTFLSTFHHIIAYVSLFAFLNKYSFFCIKTICSSILFEKKEKTLSGLVNTRKMTLSSSSDFNGTTSQKLTRFFNIFEYIFWTEVLAVIYGSVSLFGIVTNLINIRTFVKMYVTGDGVTLAFLLLAKSDLGLCCSSLVMSVISFFATFEIKGILFFPFANTASLRFLSQVDPNVIGNSAMSIMTVFNITTTLITLYVAVTRCLCVKRPLQFRNLVSCKRTIATVSCFFLFGLGTRLPVLAHMGVHMMFDPIYNASRPTLWLHPNRELIKDMMWIVCDQSLSLVTQVALLLCVIIMARSLRAANKFRQTATMAKDTADQNCSKDAQFNGSNPKLNAKEARIIQ